MKRTKRLLAILLALALAFTLALPAFAEDPDPAMPVITVQPQSVHVAYFNKGFTLFVEAYIPNGDAIGYRWVRIPPSGAEEKVGGNFASYTYTEWSAPETYYFYVEVYNRNNPELSVTSETVSVSMEPPTLWEAYILAPLRWGLRVWATTVGFTFGLTLPLTPLIILAGIIMYFIGMF